MSTEPELLMGQDKTGRACVIFADWSSGIRANWEREISEPGHRGRRLTPETARSRAAELELLARDLRAAAAWVDEHASELNGYEGGAS